MTGLINRLCVFSHTLQSLKYKYRCALMFLNVYVNNKTIVYHTSINYPILLTNAIDVNEGKYNFSISLAGSVNLVQLWAFVAVES